MIKQIRLDTVSDGRLYDCNDRVKADTGGCIGCSACCHGVGEMVQLTPFDAYEMRRHLGETLEELLVDRLELRPEGKLLLPHLRMCGDDERCCFLSEAGRCTVHGFRPNICRLFPLGRAYEQDDFKYFVQVGVCVKPELAETTVADWIGIGDYAENKAFLLAWYNVLKALAFRMKFIRDPEELEAMRGDVLETFYRIPPETGDFYAEFFRRLPEAKKRLGIL